MKERALIKQIKLLKNLKPERDFVLLEKQSLLSEAGQISHWHLFPLKEHYALLGSLAVSFLIIGVVLGMYLLNWQAADVTDLAQYETLTLSLRELEKDLDSATLALKNVKNANEAMMVKETISQTIAQGEEFLAEAKKKAGRIKPAEAPEQEVLTVLTDVEDALSQMKQTNQQMQKELTQRELEELKNNGVLTSNQQELLEQAEELFAKGSYPQALERIIEISQTR